MRGVRGALVGLGVMLLAACGADEPEVALRPPPPPAYQVRTIAFRPPPPPVAAPAPAPAVPGILRFDGEAVMDSRVWPWSAVGRINTSNHRHCTGVLVGPRQVLTAAHCLYDSRLGRWLAPDQIHFVAGYSQDRYLDHARGARVLRPEQSGRPSGAALAQNWAVVVLQEPIDVPPVPWQAVPFETLAGAASRAILTRAGYSGDRAYMLSAAIDCDLEGTARDLLLHRCESRDGDAGSPLILWSGGRPTLIGISVASSEGRRGPMGLAVPATAFDATARAALGH